MLDLFAVLTRTMNPRNSLLDSCSLAPSGEWNNIKRSAVLGRPTWQQNNSACIALLVADAIKFHVKFSPIKNPPTSLQCGLSSKFLTNLLSVVAYLAMVADAEKNEDIDGEQGAADTDSGQ